MILLIICEFLETGRRKFSAFVMHVRVAVMYVPCCIAF